jgi:hypothetical protein
MPAARAASTRRFTVCSFIGDSLEVVAEAPTLGSNLDNRPRQNLPDSAGSFDRQELEATGRAIERAENDIARANARATA